ncbi:MAG: hypothetical protein NT132_10635, partial [Microbacterium sp.]
MHDNEVGADCLGIARQFDDGVHVLVRAGQDRACTGADLIDGDVEGPLALIQRHREELALLAVDEEPADFETVNPVADVAAEAALIERQ